MQMVLPTIFSSTLGLSPPWEIKTVSFAKHEKRLDITVCFNDSFSLPCPHCGSEGSHCLMNTETWHHDSFLDYSTYLHVDVPYVKCCGTVTPVDRPWTGPGSKFSRLG